MAGRASTAVAAPSARRSAGWCSSTSRPGWHTGANAMPTVCRSRVTSSANCAALSSAASWLAASPVLAPRARAPPELETERACTAAFAFDQSPSWDPVTPPAATFVRRAPRDCPRQPLLSRCRHLRPRLPAPSSPHAASHLPPAHPQDPRTHARPLTETSAWTSCPSVASPSAMLVTPASQRPFGASAVVMQGTSAVALQLVPASRASWLGTVNAG